MIIVQLCVDNLLNGVTDDCSDLVLKNDNLLDDGKSAIKRV